jgi:ABC-2 type transport system permease protein
MSRIPSADAQRGFSAATPAVGTAQPAENATAAPPRGIIRRHANLTRELAISQFKVKYTGSVLGYVWSLLKPMLMFGMTWIVFEKLFHTGKGAANFTMQLLVAMVLFTFFADCTAQAMNSIAANGNMIRKAYFPRQILVVAATLTSLMTFAINLSLIIVVAGLLRQLHFTLDSLVVPLLLVELYALVFGLALLLSSLFVMYRDLGHIWEVGTQLMLYGSLIVYPLIPLVPQRLHTLILMNPLGQIVEDMRHALVSPGPDVPWAASVAGPLYLVPLGIVAALLVLGVLTFNRLMPRFAEYL